MKRILLIGLSLVLPTGVNAADPAAVEFFEKQVRPLLLDKCIECHGGKKTKADLSLTSRAAVLKGGESGPAAVVGKPEQSLLIKAIHYIDPPRMPPKQKLADKEIAILTQWVKAGLPWPEGAGDKPISTGTKFEITPAQRAFWSFQPVKAVTAPAVKDTAWGKSDIDRFILAELERRNLKPAKPTDKRTLIRRATYDLTGLPPTNEDVEAFVRDESPEAFAKVIDRLLGTQQYGERWGRHWLDVVRYTDSFDARGIGSEGDISEAWRYRDWVVEAFNRDLPYDQFILRQLAGDVLKDPKGQVAAEDVIATGLLALGNWGGGDADKEKLLTDIADDQVDVVGRAFMGLTLACARCHDHKFDPISTADYYGMAGIFFSTHILPNVGAKTGGPPMLRIPLASPADLAKRDAHQKRLAALEKELKTATEEKYKAFAEAQRAQTARYLLAAHDYRQRPAAQASQTVADFAAKHDLHAYALKQWLDLMAPGDYKLLTKPERDAHRFTGVHGLRGDADCPNVAVNTRTEAVKILTFTLPPRSIAMHPGPKSGVAAGWRSPIAGKVRIEGRVADADPVGGDGIAWMVQARRGNTRRVLATGEIPNGGAQLLSAGKNGVNLAAIDVQAGDILELQVLPKAEYTCDTTVIDFKIASADGGKVWDLGKDVIDDLHAGNPHADKQGNANVWHFWDVLDSKTPRSQVPELAGPLSAWEAAAGEASAGKKDRAALESAAADFAKQFTLADARSPFWIRDRADEKLLPAEAREQLATMATELNALKKTPLPPLPIANGAQEGGVPGSPHAGVHDVKVHIRGRYDRLGELVPRRFPVILAGDAQKPITSGSGRLELARWLASPEHPLTARVMVNRIWQGHFGQGIVRTPGNFGKLGERPTHPELLDHLARRFIAGGWSIKQMHREIMLTNAYQQTSVADVETQKADPDNRLFGWMNRRRLESEAVRDSLLMAAGKLDRTLGGKGVRDFNSPRRTLYQMTVRSDRSGFGPLFDVADPTAIVDKRTVSTVAPQALFLMNHPFVQMQAKLFAKRCQEVKGDDGQRVDFAYRVLYSRAPTAEEAKIGREFLGGAGAEKAWEEYSAILLCANEFMYID